MEYIHIKALFSSKDSLDKIVTKNLYKKSRAWYLNIDATIDATAYAKNHLGSSASNI